MQIVVLGMHRSGTSLLTGLLARMGCWIGAMAERTPVRSDNPHGDLERLDVWRLNEDLLACGGATWSRAERFDVDALAPGHRRAAEHRAREIVRSLDAHRPWAIKDPRLCLTLPVWRGALHAPVGVLVHRRPGPVAQSLFLRDGINLAAGVALWERYTTAALRHSEGLPRVVVSHEELIADPIAATAALYDRLVELGVGGLRRPTASEVGAWVDPALDRARMGERQEDALLSAAQRALRDALADGSASAVPAAAGADPERADLARTDPDRAERGRDG